MSTPEGWRERALALAARGESKSAIARAVGVSRMSVRKLLDPAQRAYAQEHISRWCRRRWSEDPAWRERRLADQKAYKRRRAEDPAYRERERLRRLEQKLRRCARAEAAATGRPYETICRRWRVNP